MRERILVSRPHLSEDGKSTALIQRIPVRGLFDAVDPSLNLKLYGGEIIRVPEAGQIFVLGDVKRPGAFFITDGPEYSVLKALALSEGLATTLQDTRLTSIAQKVGAAERTNTQSN